MHPLGPKAVPPVRKTSITDDLKIGPPDLPARHETCPPAVGSKPFLSGFIHLGIIFQVAQAFMPAIFREEKTGFKPLRDLAATYSQPSNKLTVKEIADTTNARIEIPRLHWNFLFS